MPRQKAPSLRELGYLPELLTTSQAAELLQLSHDHLRVLLRAGELQGVRVTGSWRIPREAILTRLEPTAPETGAGHAELDVSDSIRREARIARRLRCPIPYRSPPRSRSVKPLNDSPSARRRSAACSPADNSRPSQPAAKAVRPASQSTSAGPTHNASAHERPARQRDTDPERGGSAPRAERQDDPANARPRRPDRRRFRTARRSAARPARPKTGHPHVRFSIERIGHPYLQNRTPPLRARPTRQAWSCRSSQIGHRRELAFGTRTRSEKKRLRFARGTNHGLRSAGLIRRHLCRSLRSRRESCLTRTGSGLPRNRWRSASRPSRPWGVHVERGAHRSRSLSPSCSQPAPSRPSSCTTAPTMVP